MADLNATRLNLPIRRDGTKGCFVMLLFGRSIILRAFGHLGFEGVQIVEIEIGTRSRHIEDRLVAIDFTFAAIRQDQEFMA